MNDEAHSAPAAGVVAAPPDGAAGVRLALGLRLVAQAHPGGFVQAAIGRLIPFAQAASGSL